MSQPRIIFAGTPQFAAEHLKALLKSGFNIVAVYTQPDRPAGRGHKLMPSPVKELALAHNLPVYTPLNFKDEADIQQFAALEPELAIVVAYGVILPQAILDIPRLGCINVHASLLPKWRGAAPIQRALLSGESTTGVTIMQIVKELDAGDILCTQEVPISPNDTSESLFQLLALAGSATLVQHLPDILEQRVTPQPQNPAEVTYAAKLTKEESPLNFNHSAAALDLQVRGLYPWPVATATLDEVTYKIFATRALSLEECATCWAQNPAAASTEPGSIIGITNEGILVACGEGVLCITTLQAPGKGRVAAADYARSKKDLFAQGARFA